MSGNWNLELDARVHHISMMPHFHTQAKESDSAEGFFFESFRMPPGGEDPLTAKVDKRDRMFVAR